ncbi:hypothetical protein ACIP29_36905 [Streptomyces coelicoflavus]|uniref:hypothetical protein n=1 Tax=Streptomyces coelicoflavus TaxID=285562 RepID=UPI0038264BEB
MAAPRTLLLGCYDGTGRLRYTGRTAPFARTGATGLAAALAPTVGGHPWAGRAFTAGWGSRAVLDVTFVVPQLVVEVAVDVGREVAAQPTEAIRARAATVEPSCSAAPFSPMAPMRKPPNQAARPTSCRLPMRVLRPDMIVFPGGVGGMG